MTETMSLTGLLAAWGEGSLRARDDLFEVVYDELRGLARAYLRHERAHSVPPTALVHEAYFRLADQRQVRWQNRHHFFGIAAQAMRRVLVDRARARQAGKRGGPDRHDRPLREADARGELCGVDLLALDEALCRLEAMAPRLTRVVELHVITGLTIRETAAALAVSPATVKRDWNIARAWLYRELTGRGRPHRV